MNRKIVILSAAFTTVVLNPGRALALDGNISHATATASATVLTPITIAKDEDLKFGKFAPKSGGAGGTVVLGVTDNRTKTGDVDLAAVAGTIKSAAFTVTGTAAETYAITLPTNGSIVLNDGAAHTMACDDFTITGGTGTIGGGGTESFKVGATLTVGAAQTAGSYSTTFDVYVEYN